MNPSVKIRVHPWLIFFAMLIALLVPAQGQTFPTYSDSFAPNGLALERPNEVRNITITSSDSFIPNWLVIERHNEADARDGFSPCYTEIHSAYKPVVTRNEDGTYSIQFVSEIAAGTLPGTAK
jgi:hypothetical protein